MQEHGDSSRKSRADFHQVDVVYLLWVDPVHESGVVEEVSDIMLRPDVKCLGDLNGDFVEKLVCRGL